MQNDSMQFSASGHISEVSCETVTQQSQDKSFQCSKCILIFKSKVYLFEHLNKVHGLDIAAALQSAGLKSAETYKTSSDKNSSRSSGKHMKCQHCGFKACNVEVLNEHKKQCKKNEGLNLSGTSVFSEQPEIKITFTSANQHNEAEEEEGMPSIVSVVSLSEAECTLSSPKDLKTYKRPSQTITKDFPVDSGSNEKPNAKFTDETEGTLILQDSPSSSSPNKNGVFKVTATPKIDIRSGSYTYLQYEHLMVADLEPKPKEQLEEIANNFAKRTKSESSEGPSAKKPKSEDEKTKVLESISPSKQPSNSTDFSFEVSDEEEENNVNRAPRKQKTYFCKHCDYSNVSFSHVSFHYQNDHPFIRCKAVYIHHPNDKSATFRCLVCPVEFQSAIDLKWHYVENHPEAPDIFKMKSSELDLVFKCFECPFTPTDSKALRQHYKTQHPTFDAGNSLLFCKYSTTPYQVETPQLKTCEKTPSPERSREMSPDKANSPLKEAKNTPSPQQPTSCGSDVALHKCSKCEFAHKSVVVMHVHYQKNHPDEAMTIPKIKQLTLVTSRSASQPAPVMETPEKAKDKPELSQQKKVSLPVSEHKQEASKNHSASPGTKKVECVKDESKTEARSIKSKRKVTAGMGRLSCSSPEDLMYCQFCDYTSTSIKSVIGHHCAKHSLITSISIEEIIFYSARVRKKKSEAHLKTGKQVKERSETEAECEEKDVAGVSVTGHDAYLHAEKLFYCQECNFGNQSVLGVLNHQNKMHKHIKANSVAVLKHTALIRDGIEKSKCLANGSSSSARLPLPLINEGDENKFFCPLCNYRHGSINELMRHCTVRHNVLDAKANIQEYTSKVLKQVGTSPLKTVVNQEVKLVEMKEKNKKKRKKLVNTSSGSAPAPFSDSESPKILQCYKCQYSAKNMFLLKNHLWKSHQSNRTVTDLLRTYFRQGVIQTGYHCPWCDFSHQAAAAVLKHIKEQHPERKSSLEYVSSRFYVGPDSLVPKRKKHKIKQTHHGDDSLATQRSGQNEAEMHLCSACSYKSDSKSGLERHYQAAHPGLSKEDGLGPLNDKRASAQSQMDDLNEMPGLFESFQVPLEDAEEVISSSTIFKCSSCPATFNTEHGLNTHCGMRHLKVVNAKEAQKQQSQNQTRLHVFKCPYCAYVNTAYQGVLTHCQMKHPDLNSRADSLHVDITTLQNQDEFMQKKDTGGTWKFSGFLCKTCPQICATLDKLEKHNEQHLNKMKPSTETSNLKKTSPETSAVNTTKRSKILKTQQSASKASLLSKKASVKCSHCSYSCNTKMALKQHLYIQHKEAVSNNFVYKCELCPKFYFTKIRIGRHYSKAHGKKAFLKYFASVYKKKAYKRSSSQDHPLKLENNPTEVTKVVYRCPSCPYVNTSHHGTLTHCQMKHPAIIVRAEALEIGEILVANMIGCSLGRSSNERGYVCKKCTQIYPSLTRLKIHYERDHRKKTASKLPAQTETQRQPVNSMQRSVLEAGSFEKKASEVGVTETVPSSCSPETGQSSSVSVQDKKIIYRCQNCTYTALHRKRLRCHYRNIHKLDARSTYRLMEKYNMRKCNYLPRCAVSDKRAEVKCKICPNLMFDSSQLLIDHYSAHHPLVCKSDFIVISLGLKWKTTGVYKCAHCKTVLNGTKILWHHLERHKLSLAESKEREASADSAASEPKSTQLIRQDEVLAQQNVTSVESLALPPSSQLSSSKATDVEPQVEDKEERYACKQCRMTFMSLKGLRSHERSHAAMAAIKKGNLATSQLSIYKYVLHKSGIQKPFRCGCCAYRTNLLGLWRSHFMKTHKDIVQNGDVEADNEDEITQWPSSELCDTSEKIITLPEPDEELEETEQSLYLEPPDVQRQLNQYSLMAHTCAKSNETVQETALPESNLLHCEFCSFKSEHLSSVRRHYLSRHGKKILRCKDCSFFTGLQKTLDVHMETGHSTCQSEPTHQKDLRCPFCLYQTKNKNNMIDHIVLHREERVVPIEVRRPKLSRYLQGLVFRCHQCTFSSGNAESLRLHMMRHDDIKPYKCRLCYFDCTWLSDLEAHLSDKHQVLRNHELVGQVSLDQLKARTDISEKHDKHNNDSEDAESEEYFTDCDDIPQNLVENDTNKKMSTQAHKKAEQDKNEENPTKKSILDIQYNHANPNTTLQNMHEKDPQTQAALLQTTKEQNVAEGNNPETQFEDCSGPEKEEQRNKNQAEHKESAADENAQDHKLHLKIPYHRILDIEAKVEDDILDHILQLDRDGSMYKIHKTADQMRTGKEEQNTEPQAINLSLRKKDNIPADQNPKNEIDTSSTSALSKVNNAQRNNPKAQGGFTVERHLLTLSPSYVRAKLSHQDSLGASFAICKREQKLNLKNCKEAPEPCGQIPVLENEYLERLNHLENWVLEEEETDHLEQKQDGADDMNTETSCKDQDTPHVNKDVQMSTDEAAEDLNEENRFTCEFCGRNLTNIHELNRHVMRHGK
ncbi:zinc finger protein 462-like isoform X2 [Melanotaenia boesemani]|nr:zinc finger protein 462-like isoform X2 [Melanotaenia boesemani]